MSTARQAIAARRKAIKDPRYRGLKIVDAATSRRRMETKVRREMDRQLRKGRK